MISFLSSSLGRWLCAGVIALAVLIGCYAKGRMDEHKVLVAYKAEVEAIAKAQQEKIAFMEKQHSLITKKAEVNHAKAINSLRSTYAALRMRQPAGSGAMPQIPDSANRPDEAAAYYVSVAPELATGCAETTQQLVDLQGWISDQQQVQE